MPRKHQLLYAGTSVPVAIACAAAARLQPDQLTALAIVAIAAVTTVALVVGLKLDATSDPRRRPADLDTGPPEVLAMPKPKPRKPKPAARRRAA